MWPSVMLATVVIFTGLPSQNFALFRTANRDEVVGTLSVRFISFSNPKHLISTGTGCDLGWFGSKECDPRFTICFLNIETSWNSNSTDSVATCDFAGPFFCAYDNSGDIKFSKTICNYNNPMVLNITRAWHGAEMRVRVDEMERGSFMGSNTAVGPLIDNFSFFFNARPGADNFMKIQLLGFTQANTSIVAEAQIQCLPNYYDIKCSTFCLPSIRYSCNSKNGMRICKSGWIGEECAARSVSDELTIHPLPFGSQVDEMIVYEVQPIIASGAAPTINSSTTGLNTALTVEPSATESNETSVTTVTSIDEWTDFTLPADSESHPHFDKQSRENESVIHVVTSPVSSGVATTRPTTLSSIWPLTVSLVVGGISVYATSLPSLLVNETTNTSTPSVSATSETSVTTPASPPSSRLLLTLTTSTFQIGTTIVAPTGQPAIKVVEAVVPSPETLLTSSSTTSTSSVPAEKLPSSIAATSVTFSLGQNSSPPTTKRYPSLKTSVSPEKAELVRGTLTFTTELSLTPSATTVQYVIEPDRAVVFTVAADQFTEKQELTTPLFNPISLPTMSSKTSVTAAPYDLTSSTVQKYLTTQVTSTTTLKTSTAAVVTNILTGFSPLNTSTTLPYSSSFVVASTTELSLNTTADAPLLTMGDEIIPDKLPTPGPTDVPLQLSTGSTRAQSYNATDAAQGFGNPSTSVTALFSLQTTESLATTKFEIFAPVDHGTTVPTVDHSKNFNLNASNGSVKTGGMTVKLLNANLSTTGEKSDEQTKVASRSFQLPSGLRFPEPVSDLRFLDQLNASVYDSTEALLIEGGVPMDTLKTGLKTAIEFTGISINNSALVPQITLYASLNGNPFLTDMEFGIVLERASMNLRQNATLLGVPFSVTHVGSASHHPIMIFLIALLSVAIVVLIGIIMLLTRKPKVSRQTQGPFSNQDQLDLANSFDSFSSSYDNLAFSEPRSNFISDDDIVSLEPFVQNQDQTPQERLFARRTQTGLTIQSPMVEHRLTTELGRTITSFQKPAAGGTI